MTAERVREIVREELARIEKERNPFTAMAKLEQEYPWLVEAMRPRPSDYRRSRIQRAWKWVRGLFYG